ncbi:MAG: hypothetical protein AB7T14_03720 [Candidatus Methylacidiphilaceae bacterium]
MKRNSIVKKSALLLGALGLLGSFSLFPLHAQHQRHGGAKKGDLDQVGEEQDEHQGHSMEGMEHGMSCGGGGGMGGMSHGMMGGMGGGSESWDQVLREVEDTKKPKATARKLRMKADLMKADAAVLEKYAKELESETP